MTVSAIDIEFYSEDWRRMKVLAIASLSYFDLMANEDNLYLIELPKYNSAVLGLFLGFFIFFPMIGPFLVAIGVFLGAFIGSQMDAKRRKNYRSTWLNFDHKIKKYDQ